jgi:glycine/serine hydroxymethyltransferase
MREPEMQVIAGLIDRVLGAAEDAAVIAEVKGKVEELTARFPLYPGA